MKKNDKYQEQEKKPKRKHTAKNPKHQKAYIPLYPNQMQPVLMPAPMTPMMNGPQPIYQMAPVAPAYPMMQPVPQQMPKRYTMAVPIGPPKTVMVPVGPPMTVATPMVQPVMQMQPQPIQQVQPPKPPKPPKQQKPPQKVIIIKERIVEDDDFCSLF